MVTARRPGRDVEAVDELCRLALHAARLGCRVLLVDVDPALRDMLELAGVDQLLLEAPHESEDLP
jgi:anti-anti-sigma regulatory factor